MDTLISKSKELVTTLVNLVYPRICLICKKALDQDIYPLCKRCLGSIKMISPPHCIKCGRHLEVESTCGECRKRTSYLERVWSPALYDGVMKECIHYYKYKNRLRLTSVFRKIMLEFSIENPFIENMDLIVPVPLHPARLRERAYNQAYMLAKELSMSFSIPIDNKGLKKVKNTKPQSNLDKPSRLKNITSSFRVRQKRPLDKKRILLVDDVYTTGATLNECARILLEAGAKSVSAFTLARGA